MGVVLDELGCPDPTRVLAPERREAFEIANARRLTTKVQLPAFAQGDCHGAALMMVEQRNLDSQKWDDGTNVRFKSNSAWIKEYWGVIPYGNIDKIESCLISIKTKIS